MKPTLYLIRGAPGAGKTTFTKQLAKDLDIKETVISPTFILRKDSEGDISYRNSFERDINEVAKEIFYLEEDEDGKDSTN
jgi:tRNA threonylcarbamoyladenosine biosynthesis protein TsaE